MGGLAAGLRTAIHAAEPLAPAMAKPPRAAWEAGELGGALKDHPMFTQWKNQKVWGAMVHTQGRAMLKCSSHGRVRELAHLQDVENGGPG